jgi:hypothetical protein
MHLLPRGFLKVKMRKQDENKALPTVGIPVKQMKIFIRKQVREQAGNV